MAAKEVKSAASVGRAQSQRVESFKKGWYKFSRNPLSILGLAVVVAVILAAIFAYQLVPYPEDAGLTVKLNEAFEAPSAAHWAGTDEYGRDIFSRMIIGTRSALVIGILVLAISVPTGVFLGLIAGYYKGKAVSRFVLWLT